MDGTQRLAWSGQRVTALAVAVGAAVAVHLAEPRGVVGDGTYLAIIWLAAALAWAGVRRAPTGARLVPALVAAGLTSSAVADLTWLGYVWSGLEPDVSLADIPFFGSYAALAGALVLITSNRFGGGGRVDVDAVIDALTVIVVSVVVLWAVSIRDIVSDDSMSALTRGVLAAYPVADAVLLALVVRVLAVGRLRSAVGVAFGLGVGCWLAADLGYLLLSASDSASVSAILDAGWMVGGILIAQLAWRADLTPAPRESTVGEPRGSGLGRLAIAILPLLVPPVLLTINGLRDERHGWVEALVAMSALLLLAFVRTARLLQSERRARAELAVARDAALEGSRAKSAFLATMSHEIRTPMNGVTGLTELLLGTELDDRQQDYAQGIQTAGRSLLEIINDILDFSKIEAGRLELEHIDFDLVRVVEDAAGVVAEAAQEKQLELLAYCSPELPLGLRGDPGRIRQVLLNLASNAVKFTAEGEVVVCARLEGFRDADVVVRFEVSDTGIGISELDRDRIFEPFSQGDSSTTRMYGGTGLGLAICRQLVAAMGGELGVDSTPGLGSSFWFTVPLQLPVDTAVATPPSTETLAGLRVLVVDDNQTNRLILHDQLHAWGMEVVAVADAAGATKELRDALAAGRPFALALLDLCMPEVDGLGLAEEITGAPELAGTGLVLLTSGPDVTLTRARAVGIDVSLTKPVQLSRLHTTLQEVVAGRTPAAAPSADRPASPRLAGWGHVLVVEDSEINQLVAEGILQYLGYTATIAENGVEALAAMRTATYDAVLMDVQMPQMDGYEATAEIRRVEGDRRHTPVIAMTAGAVPGDRERALAAGMDDYVVKPITPEALAAALERWVSTG